jgi:hypothetical protein
VSRGGQDWKKLPPLPVDITDEELLDYKTVRKMLGMKSNSSIKRGVADGRLKRIRVNKARWGFRIVAAGVLAMRREMEELAEAAKEFGYSPAQMRALQQARKRAPVPQVTPELDAREIIRQAHNLTEKAPPPFVPSAPSAAPASQTDGQRLAAYFDAKGAQRITAYRALTWKQRNRIIESQRQPEPEFDLVAYRKRVAERGY